MNTLCLLAAQIRLSLVSHLQYRVDYLLTIFSVVVSSGVEIALWRLVMKARGQVQGFGLTELIVYLVIANVTNMMRVNWDSVLSMSEEIRSGVVARHLLKPVSLYVVTTGEWLAGKIPVMIGAVFVFIAIHFFVPLQFHPGPAHIALFTAFMALSLWISSEIYFIIVLTAFWVSENEGVAIAFNVLGWAFLGTAFPLSFYPTWLQSFLDATPLPYMVYYPVLTLTERIPLSTAGIRFLCAALMCLALTLARRSMWDLSERRLQTVGG